MKRIDKTRLNKRGQEAFGMSFGMIFSIILIVVFIITAFIAIKHFLSLGKTADVGLFYKELQDSVDNSWQSQSGEYEFSLSLPEKVHEICFANLSAGNVNVNSFEYKEIERYKAYNANTFIIPGQEAAGMEFKIINHLNITKTTKTKNPYCVNATGKIKIKKDFYDRLVSIE